MYIEDPRVSLVRNLNRYVEQYCAARHFSQAEFARRCRISPPSLVAYLQGQRFPRAEVLYALATELNIPCEWLIRSTNHTNTWKSDAANGKFRAYDGIPKHSRGALIRDDPAPAPKADLQEET